MSVQVLVEIKVQADKVDDFTAYIASIIADTRGYDGCEKMTFTVNQDDPTDIMFMETWESREKYEKYFAWREESGSLDALGSMLAGAPSKRFYDEVAM